VDRGQHRESSSRSVAELIERWLSWRQQVRPISPVTVANYRGAIDAMRPHVLVQRVDVEASTCWTLARPRFGRSQVLVQTRQNPSDATDEGACHESSRIFLQQRRPVRYDGRTRPERQLRTLHDFAPGPLGHVTNIVG
jgi:hypothetical protein